MNAKPPDLLPETSDRLIVTAAASADAASLQALLGSLTLNWPRHPPVLVYDLGLDKTTVAVLADNAVRVHPGVLTAPHRESRDNWALFCLNDAPAVDLLWLDARTVVLGPMDEVFEALRTTGRFLVPDARVLDCEVSDELCHACGVSLEDRRALRLLAITVVGFRKAGTAGAILREACARAFANDQRTDDGVAHAASRKILSLLVARHHWQADLAESGIYNSARSPAEVLGQKIWVHRRKLLKTDALHFGKHLSQPGPAYQPQSPFTLAQAHAVERMFAAFHCFIREQRTEAELALRDALARDVDFMTSSRIAAILDGYRLAGINQGHRAASQRFVGWAVGIVKDARGGRVARRVLSAARALEGLHHLQLHDAEGGCRLLIRSFCTHPTFALANRVEILKRLNRVMASEGQLPASAELSPNGTRW